VSVELAPFARADLEAALVPFTELAPLARSLCAAFPPPLGGFHRLRFDEGRVALTLLIGEAHAMLKQLVARADPFFPDGSAPARTRSPFAAGTWISWTSSSARAPRRSGSCGRSPTCAMR